MVRCVPGRVIVVTYCVSSSVFACQHQGKRYKSAYVMSAATAGCACKQVEQVMAE